MYMYNNMMFSLFENCCFKMYKIIFKKNYASTCIHVVHVHVNINNYLKVLNNITSSEKGNIETNQAAVNGSIMTVL